MTSSSSREDVKSLVICEDSAALETKTAARSKFRQHVAAILANLATLCIGMANAWTAPALPLIQRQTDVVLPLFATDEEASWISSLLPIGAVVGALPAGFLADRLGRRRVLLMMAIPYFLGWMLIVLAEDSIVQVYQGRIIIGLAAGVCSVLVPMYTEEIAEDANRGALGVYFDFTFCIGILVMYVLGALFPYMYFTLMSAVVPVMFGMTFFAMPESPTYLISKNLFPEAEKALLWLRNSSIFDDTDIQPEIERLRSRVQEVNEDNSGVCNKPTLKAIGIILGLFFFQQMSGINAIIFYIVQIFQNAGTSLPAVLCSIIVGIVQVVATFLPTIAVDSLGRRPLLIMSAFFMAICLGVVSGYFYFKESTTFYTNPWMGVPLVAFVGYMIALSLGFGPLPYCMMAELVPTPTKGRMSALSISFSWAMIVLVTKVFPHMLVYLGHAVTYGIFSGMCVLATVFVVICVPETKGKSREEIQLLLGNTPSLK